MLKELQGFHDTYLSAGKLNGFPAEMLEENFAIFTRLVHEELKNPYKFSTLHRPIETPFDYYSFGLQFFKPLVLKSSSQLFGKENLIDIEASLLRGENAIFFANHQTEPDPQCLSLLLEKEFPKLAKNLIFVAGHRVLEDPLAIPFSKGCYILSIYSKRHVEFPPEKRSEKILHNKKTMLKLRELLDEGGHAIYVAPSGGRDRPDAEGNLFPAALNQDSLELFYLLGKKSGRPTHFYPLALSTYALMPPPDKIENALGEKRTGSLAPIKAFFGAAFNFSPFENLPKDIAQKNRCQHVEKELSRLYHHLLEN